MRFSARNTAILTLTGLLSVMLAGCSGGAKKIKIATADDLPQHTYPCTAKVSEMVVSREAIMDLAKKVRANVESDLNKYQIDDASTLQSMYGTLMTIDMLEKKYDSALKRVQQIRKLEKKEAKKLTIGMSIESMIAARREVGCDAPAEKYAKVFREELAKRASKLPWKVVEDTIQQSKGRWEIYNETLIVGAVKAGVDPVVEKTGALNGDQAASVIGRYYMLSEQLPLKPDFIAVYQKLIDENHTVKPDIWAARSVTLSSDADCHPVLVAAWDSGTDPDVFDGRLFTNPNEKPNGVDDDGNGFVDDIHGIAYDIHANKATGMLCPLGDAAERIAGMMNYLKGMMDLQAAIDSREASAIKKHLSEMNPADIKTFFEDMGLAGNYSHGTHVAGIMLDGNPCAQLLIARLSYDHRMVPVARNEEWGKRDGDKCRNTVEYFKQNGVRVVNMSWGESQEDAEKSLEANGVGSSAEERREIARKVFQYQKEGLYEAIKNAPDILFVAAAGNSDNDVAFDEYIPSSFDLPNLITVGAVDQAGEPTSFTSSGKIVQVYANGFEVDSFVPGGKRMKMSGTSMASPNVANLAGKLLAIDPSLKPAQVADLIKRGADKTTSGGQTFLLMNPKKSVALLRGK